MRFEGFMSELINKNEFIKKIRNANEDELIIIATEVISIPVPWFFETKTNIDARAKYNEFRNYMAKKFKVSSDDVLIGGSALLGFSLSPQKVWKPFDDNSDIDIIIINEKEYKRYWDYLFDDCIYHRLTGDSYCKNSKNIFKRFIDTNDNYLLRNSKTKALLQRTSGYQKDLQIYYDFPEKIGYRIYKTIDDYKKNLIMTFVDIKMKEGTKNYAID